MKIVNEEINRYISKLKRMRVSLGLTQTGLADLSGVNSKSIARYEQNPDYLMKASVETVHKLCDSLGCTMEDILNL